MKLKITVQTLLVALPALTSLASQAANIPLSQMPVPVPADNPITESKRQLGKILFWDEQLSSDDTVACGSCHKAAAGGADPNPAAHPGPDGLFGTEDDTLGSHGIRHYDANLNLVADASFGFQPQVTGRATPSFINAAFANELFWDGRASASFSDPLNPSLELLPNRAALESQAVGPILSSVEMAASDRSWNDVTTKLARVTPLALASNIPADIAPAIAAGQGYPGLFAAAFGDSNITPARIAMAIATYERTLVADQTPWDRFIAGDATAMTQRQIAGWELFDGQSLCGRCHVPPLFSDNRFYNLGLRPAAEDIGHMLVTDNSRDYGRFKVPSLRNLGLRPALMHVGWVTDARDAIAFYNSNADAANGIANRHQQFHEDQSGIPTTTPGVTVPYSNLSLASGNERPQENVADFLANALTDPRVAAETFPFDRPTLGSERRHNMSSALAFMSYNIGGADWQSSRAEAIANVINSSLADLVALQEAGATPLQQLQPLLNSSYALADVGSNGMPLLYNSQKLHLLQSGSSAPGDMLFCTAERFINYALFQDKQSGSQFLIFNTHFCAPQATELPSGYSAAEVNLQHAGALANFVAKIGASWQVPAVVAGDLNATENSATMEYLLGTGQIDGNPTPAPLADSWSQAQGSNHSGVDWLLYLENGQQLLGAQRLINSTTEAASDHFPMTAALIFNSKVFNSQGNGSDDTDADGAPDDEDAFPFNPAEWLDTDNDGIGNNGDSDDDNDGVPDATDAFPLNAAEWLDTDNDGIGNNGDSDDDNDGVTDNEDAFPLNAAEWLDTDNDGIGNNGDSDDDNDGVTDNEDAFPLNAAEWLDTDNDGIGNNGDSDDDNDGVPDATDAFPLDPSRSQAAGSTGGSDASSSGGAFSPWLLLLSLIATGRRRLE
ncbi:cytochrome c peroxidase [Shewanella cyperi]|uniref:cytochrome c peroxidase n=1 Tax=Shewanella cyperi TaxID=2814292 RepID=UPI001D191AF2|nr:cytochrome c peroxidase [Shewanella cyperi]